MPKVTITIDVENGIVVVKNQQVSLCKSCGKPVDELSKTTPCTTPSVPVHIQSLTGTARVPRTTVSSTAKTDYKSQEQTPFSFDPDQHPFALTGLTPAQVQAIGYMVAVFAQRDERQRGEPMPHGDFNDALYAILEASGATDQDAILQEAWNPRFWRTRPEFTVTVETIAPNPALL